MIGLITEKGMLRAYAAAEALQNKRAGKPVADPPYESYVLGDPRDPVFLSRFLREHTVEEVMNRTTVTVHWDEPLERAAYLMKEHGYSILPVVGDENRLVGVIGRSASPGGGPAPGPLRDPRGAEGRHRPGAAVRRQARREGLRVSSGLFCDAGFGKPM